jgi:putative NIF3 family GTP cyclohydrolase 1 type 2
MNLQQILEWSARLAGCEAVPADSQVYVEATSDVHRVLFGVDMGVAELLFAREAGFDAVIAHHPAGDRARIDMPLVVRRQVEQMVAEGIDRADAEAAVAERLDAPHRAMHAANLNQVIDTARLIGLPFANIHLACDIISRQALIDCLQSHRDDSSTVGDAITWLDGFPEIANGLTRPEAWLGSPGSRLGRFTVAIAGGYNGGYPAFSRYFRAGIDTIFTMHVLDPDLMRLREDPVSDGRSLVVTGHMATDSIGINRVIAGLQERDIEVVRTSGIVAA